MWVLQWLWEHVKEIGAAVAIVGVITTFAFAFLNRGDTRRERRSDKERKKPFGRLQIGKARLDDWRAVSLHFHNPSGEAFEVKEFCIEGDKSVLITLHAPNRDVNARPKPDIDAAASCLSVRWTIGLSSSSGSSFAGAREFWIKLPDLKPGSSRSRSSRIVVTAKAISSSERLIKIRVPIPMDA